MIAKYNIKFTEEQDLNKAKKRILKRQKQKHLLDPTQIFEVSMEKQQEAMNEFNELNKLILQAISEIDQIKPFMESSVSILVESFFPILIKLDNNLKTFSNKLLLFIPNSIYVSLDDLNSLKQNVSDFIIKLKPVLENYITERPVLLIKIRDLKTRQQAPGRPPRNIDLPKLETYIDKFDSILIYNDNIGRIFNELLKNYNEKRAIYRQPQGQTAIEIVGGSRGFDRIYSLNEKYMPIYI